MAVALLLFTVFLSACNESLSSDPARPAREESSVSVEAARAREALHARNTRDWVGVAHNAAIDAFRSELRKTSPMRQSCENLAEFFSRQDLFVPEEHRTQANVVRTIVLQGLEPCRRKVPSTTKKLVEEGSGLTASAAALVNQTEFEVEQATSSYDLAVRLQPVLAASASLDTVGQAAVGVSVGVAQNSLEYWESQFASFSSEIVAEYGPCFTDLRLAGFTFDDALEACLGGAYSLAVSMTNGTARSVWPTSARSIQCGPGSAWQNMVRTAKEDVDGAATGFVGGLLTTKNIQLAVSAGIGAGAAKSVVEAVKATMRLYDCAMTPKTRTRTGGST
jgi:hypothetical protein